MTSEDLLGGNIPLKASTSKAPSTKRLNKIPIAGAVVVLLLVSFLVTVSLTKIGDRQVIKSSEDDFQPMPTASYIDAFLSGRGDGTIGEVKAAPVVTPSIFDESVLYDKPISEEETVIVVPTALPVPVAEKKPDEVDPLQAKIDEMMREQFLTELQEKHNRHIQATKATTAVKFNTNNAAPENAGMTPEEVRSQAMADQRSVLANTTSSLDSMMKLVEGRMVGALQEADAEAAAKNSDVLSIDGNVQGPNDASSSEAARLMMPSGGVLKSRGGLRVVRRVPRRQTSIQQEVLDGEVPRTLKNEFLLRQREADSNYLGHSRLAPITKSEIQAGTVIRANLISGINSELPGNIIAQVSRNVFDTANGEHVLIPQGSRLLGIYENNQRYGDSRVLIAWKRLLYPDGSSLNLDGMQGYDPQGFAGFSDQVDNHWDKVLGGAIFMSVLSSGVSAVSSNTEEALEDGSVSASSRLFQEETAKELAKVGSKVAERALAVQPTIVIRPGYTFVVMVDKDVILPPYKPMHKLYERHYELSEYSHPRNPFKTDRDYENQAAKGH